jgi:hypothetical protein
MPQLPSINGYPIAEITGKREAAEVYIYGDAQGLRSLAKLLIAVADLDQPSLPDTSLPKGDSFHTHVELGWRVKAGCRPLRIGRVEDKETGKLRACFPQPTCDLEQGLPPSRSVFR